jgi:hypothetical protein
MTNVLITTAEIIKVMSTLASLAAPTVKVFAKVPNDEQLYVLPEDCKKHLHLALGLIGTASGITPEQLDAHVDLTLQGGRVS